MKRIFILAFLLAWLTAQFAAAAAVDTLAVRSASMDRDIPVIVILPDGASPANPCPTVYLLHGYGGNQTTWLRIKPSLPAIADREGIAFVCPDGATSWYLDSKVRAKSLYETFMTRELLPAVEERYPVSRDRSGRAITGLSMGGFGAVSLAIRHKELFGAVGSTSGGLDIRPFPENWEIPQLLGTQAEHPEAWEAAVNAKIARDILDGAEGSKTDVVLLNAGAAIYLASDGITMKEGVEKAREIIKSGLAKKQLERFIEETNK